MKCTNKHCREGFWFELRNYVNVVHQMLSIDKMQHTVRGGKKYSHSILKQCVEVTKSKSSIWTWLLPTSADREHVGGNDAAGLATAREIYVVGSSCESGQRLRHNIRGDTRIFVRCRLKRSCQITRHGRGQRRGPPQACPSSSHYSPVHSAYRTNGVCGTIFTAIHHDCRCSLERHYEIPA